MSDTSARNLFNLKKEALASSFVDGARTVRDTLSSRALSCVPGIGFEAIFSLQKDYRSKMDETVLAVLEQQIEREMRLLGVQKDIEYKNALMAFEVEKAGVLNAFNEEIARLSLEDAMLDDEVEYFLASVQARQVVIINFSAYLEKQRQLLLQQKADAERLSFESQLALVNQQLLTAQKKLDIIPQLKLLCDAQLRAIGVERGPVYDEMQNLLAARKSLSELKLTAVQPLLDKAEAALALATGQQNLIPYLAAKAAMTLNLANANSSFSINYQVPAANAYVGFVSTQATALPYMNMVSNQKRSLAETETSVAQKMVEKASADYRLATAELSVAQKASALSQKMITVLLPTQRDLAASVLEDVKYRKEASALRVLAAQTEIDIAEYNAKGVLSQCDLEIAQSLVSLARINYSLFEKKLEASVSEAESNASDSISAAVSAAVSARVSAAMSASAAEVSSITSVIEYQNSWKLEVAQTLNEAEKSFYKDTTDARIKEIEKTNYYQSNQNISVGLSHIIAPLSSETKTGTTK